MGQIFRRRAVRHIRERCLSPAHRTANLVLSHPRPLLDMGTWARNRAGKKFIAEHGVLRSIGEK